MTYATVTCQKEITGKKARKWFYAQSENLVYHSPWLIQMLIQLTQATTEDERRDIKNVLRNHLDDLMQYAEEVSRLIEIPEVKDEAEKTGFLAWLQWFSAEMSKAPGKLATIKEDEFQKRLREVDVTEAF